jgi:3-dehydroquinate dehydratase-2
MAKILLLQGPNLNLLGRREPYLYGSTNLPQLHAKLEQQATEQGHELRCLQSNNEHELIDAIHHCLDVATDYIIFNPAAFTHTSIALRDALLAVNIPFIEVHISNIAAREAFRQQSYFSDIAMGIISGFGINSYTLALQALTDCQHDFQLKNREQHGHTQS